LTTSLYVRLPHRPIQSPERWQAGALASVPFALVREEGTQGAQRILREGIVLFRNVRDADWEGRFTNFIRKWNAHKEGK